MDTSGMKIREVEAALFPADGTEVSQDLIEACRLDARQGVARLVRRYEREQAERERVAALYAYENAAADEGYELVAGVDEAGRGPLAGPVPSRLSSCRAGCSCQSSMIPKRFRRTCAKSFTMKSRKRPSL